MPRTSSPSPAPPRRPRRRASPGDAAARIALDRLGRAVERELDRRRVEAELEDASATPVDVQRLSAPLRDLGGLAQLAAATASRAARLRRADVARAIRGAADLVTTYQEVRRRQAEGEIEPDIFGFDPQWTELLMPVARLAYRQWWRVQVRGVENVPAEGRVMIVGNHAGVIPYDGAMVRMAVLEEHPRPRHLHALVLSDIFATPGASWLVRRTGNTLANTDDAEALLQQEQAVLVFPEGAKGTGKPYRERYRLRRFGRGGFAELAIRNHAPIVPVSIVGSEEIHPMLADLTPLARLIGQPYAPVTPTFPWLGPLGVIPLPSSWIIEFHPPVEPGRRDDARSVLALSDRVRATIQRGVYANLEERGSVFAR